MGRALKLNQIAHINFPHLRGLFPELSNMKIDIRNGPLLPNCQYQDRRL